MSNCEEYLPLLVGLLDQELTPEEAQKINNHLNRCESCRKEFEEMREMSDKLTLPSFKEPEEEVLEQLWNSPYSRFTRNAGLLLVAFGYLGLIGYGLYKFLIDRSAAVFPKVAVTAIIFGFVILLGSVIRARLKTYKNDPYKEVKR